LVSVKVLDGGIVRSNENIVHREVNKLKREGIIRY